MKQWSAPVKGIFCVYVKQTFNGLSFSMMVISTNNKKKIADVLIEFVALGRTNEEEY